MSLFGRKPAGVPVDSALGDPVAARLVAAVRAEDLGALRGAFAEMRSVDERSGGR